MNKQIVPLILAVLIFAGRPAVAIPPPWELEGWKAASDLILIGKTTKIEPVAQVAGVNSRVGLVPVKVLKGKMPAKGQGPDARSPLPVLFSKLKPPKIAPGIRVHVQGGTGHPNIAEGETALVFLKADPKQEGSFRVAYGSFGYIGLDAKTEQDLAAVKERINRYRQWSRKIGDEATRLAMDSYYQTALALAGKSENTRASDEAPQPEEAACRTWTDRTGEHQIEAVLLGLENGQVRLKKKDGTIVRIAIENLSKADQAYVKRQTSGENN